MPKIRRQKLPRAVIELLALRVRQRENSLDQIGLVGDRCDTNPEVPEGESTSAAMEVPLLLTSPCTSGMRGPTSG